MTLRSVHVLSDLGQGSRGTRTDRAGTRTRKIAATSRMRSICTISARVRRRVEPVAGIQTRADELLTLAGSDQLHPHEVYRELREIDDDGLLTHAFSREAVQANSPIRRPINGAGWDSRRQTMKRGELLP
jgi:hypothetical protein